MARKDFARSRFERSWLQSLAELTQSSGAAQVLCVSRRRRAISAFVAQGRAQGKSVAITEFGCTTHRGAADGGGDLDFIVWGDDGRPARLNGKYVRDEDEQATYLRAVLEVFEAEGVDNAFVNTFARYDLPHRSDPREDFDMASFGVVKVLDGQSGSGVRRYPDMPWEPKAAFSALANHYCRQR